MSDLIWLPPLNPHAQNHITVKISQAVAADFLESVSRPMFVMKFGAYVDFFSDKKDTTQRSFRGLSVEDYYHVPCDYVTSEFSKSFVELTLYNLCSFGFEGDITWAERHLVSDGNWQVTPSESFEETDVFDKIQNFLRGMTEKEYNASKNVLVFNLTVRKKVIIPEEELRSWNSWYAEKKRMDPGFEIEFRRAISRPRTEDELINEIDIASRGTLTSSIWEKLEVVEVEDRLRLISSQSFCSICLEEFLVESQVIMKLPCGHMFGENCIRKWLQQSNTCPYCRFTLQSSVDE